MQIECIRKRSGGTHVEIDGAPYHFSPRSDGRHIAEVENPKHIRRFLTIEAYHIPGETDEADDDDDKDVIAALAAAENDEATQTTAPISAEPGAEEGETEAADAAGEAPGEANDREPVAEGYDAMSEEALNRLYMATVGRAPHPNAKRETIIAKIELAKTA